jgi:hypothetical protein
MFVVFLLSPLREEMYPWYAQWFLVFLPFLSHKKLIVYLSLILSFSLLLRYVPFMYLGTYFGPTPLLRILLAGLPLIVGLFVWFFNKKKIEQFFL